MTIYLSHSRGFFDFRKDFYGPCLAALAKQHKLLIPHQSDQPLDVKGLIKNGKCDAIIAEISHPSTGQGIELAWASDKKIRIVGCFMNGTKPSASLDSICTEWIQYSNPSELSNLLSDRF